MKFSEIKYLFIALVMICTGLFATCEFTKQVESMTKAEVLQDTVFLSQWRREKAEKLQLISAYEKKLSRLQSANDSLRQEVNKNKKTLGAYRFKANHLQKQLRETVRKADSTGIVPDTLTAITDSYIEAERHKDSLCEETIQGLEQIIAHRDSSVLAHETITKSLKEYQSDYEQAQQVQTDHLKTQLNLFIKDAKKKKRQTVFLRTGIGILTGISASLLIKQAIQR